MTDQVKIAAGIFMFNSQGKPVVVSTRADAKQYGIPGGKLDPNETPVQAAIREAYEETGIILKEEDIYPCFEDVSRVFKMVVFAARHPVDAIPGGIEEGIAASFGEMSNLVADSPYADFNTKMFSAMSENEHTHPYLRHSIACYFDTISGVKPHYDNTALLK